MRQPMNDLPTRYTVDEATGEIITIPPHQCVAMTLESCPHRVAH